MMRRRNRGAGRDGAAAAKVTGDRRSSPRPVVVQRRARAARHARARSVLIRVGALLVADLLILSIDYSIADFLRSSYGPSERLAQLLVDLIPRGTLPRVEVLFAVILGLTLLRNYGPGPYRRSPGRLFAGSSLGLSMVFWSAIWDGVSVIGVVGFAFALIGLGSSLFIGRQVVEFFVASLRPLQSNSRAMVVGTATDFERIRHFHGLDDRARLDLMGYVLPDNERDAESLGSLNEMPWLLDAFSIDIVMIATQPEEAAFVEILSLCDETGCSAIGASPLSQARMFVPRIVSIGSVPVVELYRPSLRAPQLAMKRIFDFVLASVLLILLLPLLLVVALAVAFTSRGPVIFSQDRVGYAGRKFRMHKFRTMVADAENQKQQLRRLSLYPDDRMFKVKDDPRITPLGRFLRRTSIDELPQLWNVIRGQMSLVGPRPPLTGEVEKYEEHHYSRFDMKPGITGPWQVAGRSEVTSFEEIVALDTAYLTNWTLARDFVILMKTVPAIVTMRGAL